MEYEIFKRAPEMTHLSQKWPHTTSFIYDVHFIDNAMKCQFSYICNMKFPHKLQNCTLELKLTENDPVLFFSDFYPIFYINFDVAHSILEKQIFKWASNDAQSGVKMNLKILLLKISKYASERIVRGYYTGCFLALCLLNF